MAGNGLNKKQRKYIEIVKMALFTSILLQVNDNS